MQNSELSPKAAIIIAIILSILASAFSTGALHFFKKEWEESKVREMAIGQIIQPTAQEGELPSLLIKFTDLTGQEHFARSSKELSSYYEIGESAVVFYDPSQPERAINSNDSGQDASWLMVLSIFAFVSWFFVFTLLLFTVKHKVIRLFASVFYLGLASFLLSNVAYNSYVDLVQTEEIEGYVIDNIISYHTDSDGDSSTNYYPIYKFEDEQGRWFTVKSTIGYGSSVTTTSTTFGPITRTSTRESMPNIGAAGDTVTLLYRPDAPHETKLKGFASLWLVKILMAFAGLILLLLGISALLNRNIAGDHSLDSDKHEEKRPYPGPEIVSRTKA